MKEYPHTQTGDRVLPIQQRPPLFILPGRPGPNPHLLARLRRALRLWYAR